jgi:hypothetical protein
MAATVVRFRHCIRRAAERLLLLLPRVSIDFRVCCRTLGRDENGNEDPASGCIIPRRFCGPIGLWLMQADTVRDVRLQTAKTT